MLEVQNSHFHPHPYPSQLLTDIRIPHVGQWLGATHLVFLLSICVIFIIFIDGQIHFENHQIVKKWFSGYEVRYKMSAENSQCLETLFCSFSHSEMLPYNIVSTLNIFNISRFAVNQWRSYGSFAVCLPNSQSEPISQSVCLIAGLAISQSFCGLLSSYLPICATT